MSVVTDAQPTLAIDELVEQVRELASGAAAKWRDEVVQASKRPHNMPCGEIRHAHIFWTGHLNALCSVLAMATGQDSDALVHMYQGSAIR